MTKMNPLKTIFSALTLVLIGGTVACSGGGGSSNNTTPPPKTIADRLDYTDPTSGTYRLVKNTTLSTQTHLVLDLIAPGTTASGVGFYLTLAPATADSAKVTWTTTTALVDTSVFNLGTTPTKLLAVKINGVEMQAGVYQKGATLGPVTFGATTALARVSLDLKSNVPIGTVALSAGKALITNGGATPLAIAITPGTLQAN